VWNAFIAGALNRSPLKVSAFTPSNAITITRIQVFFQTSPVACGTNAVLQLSNGTVSGTKALELLAATNDSGAISVPSSAGVPILLSITSRARCAGGTLPADANVVLQYKAQ